MLLAEFGECIHSYYGINFCCFIQNAQIRIIEKKTHK